MKVVPISTAQKRPLPKALPANQKAIDALPFNAGTWRIQGVPGLYVRSRAKTKSYFLQRRVRGTLVKLTLGEMTLKTARARAMEEWAKLKPVPAGGRKTLGQAFGAYLEENSRSENEAQGIGARTREIYNYNFNRHLSQWKDRALEDLGRDRAGVLALYHHLRRKYGGATASSVIRMLAAVYRYAEKTNEDLPKCPTAVITLPRIKARDWALSADELRAWWAAVQTLTPVRRMWWLTALFTGARRGSVEALRWEDLDLEKKLVRFRVAKGDRAYTVPLADKLAELLLAYRDSGKVPPSEWLFPSPAKPDYHLVAVRDNGRGVQPPHRLRHTFRTTLTELGSADDQAKLLMGHSLGGSVSHGYVTIRVVVESLRSITNAVAARYEEILGGIGVADYNAPKAHRTDRKEG